MIGQIEYIKVKIDQAPTINLRFIVAKIIGIGGVSRSGKSNLARQIKNHFAKRKVLIISQDEFVIDETNIPKVGDRTDWEHPDSIDLGKILETVEDNKNECDLIIIEGILAFYFDELNTMYDKRIILNISKETFLNRRKQETRWGEEPEWFLAHVWESFLNYSNSELKNSIYISGEDQVDLDAVIDKLEINS